MARRCRKIGDGAVLYLVKGRRPTVFQARPPEKIPPRPRFYGFLSRGEKHPAPGTINTHRGIHNERGRTRAFLFSPLSFPPSWTSEHKLIRPHGGMGLAPSKLAIFARINHAERVASHGRIVPLPPLCPARGVFCPLPKTKTHQVSLEFET